MGQPTQAQLEVVGRLRREEHFEAAWLLLAAYLDPQAPPCCAKRTIKRAVLSCAAGQDVLQEVYLLAAYQGCQRMGCAALELALRSAVATPEHAELAAAIACFYATRAPMAGAWRLAAPPRAPGWATFNPTLLSVRSSRLPEACTVRVLLRQANYAVTQPARQRYVATVVDEDGVVRNHYLRGSVTLGLWEPHGVLPVAVGPPLGALPPQAVLADDVPVQGYEDLRVVPLDGDSAGPRTFFGTCMECEHSGRLGVALLTCDEEGRVAAASALPSPTGAAVEKNWLPWRTSTDEQALCIEFVYSWYPFRLGRVRAPQGGAPTVHLTLDLGAETPLWLTDCRGSAPPIPWRRGWLALVHTVRVEDSGHRTYCHRFVELEEASHAPWQLLPRRCSRPFHFGLGAGADERHTVQYCTQMLANGDGGDLLLGVGVADREAWIVSLTRRNIEELFTLYPSRLEDSP